MQQTSSTSQRSGASSPESIEFYFDPGCPWTWMTSRWLVDAAGQRGISIEWRSLSLGVLNAGRDIPEQFRPMMAAGAASHRVIAALLAADRNDLIGDFYAECGRRIHHDASAPTVELIREIAVAAGAASWADAVDDYSWDEAVAESTHFAIGLVGPDVGSPVIAFGTPRNAIFGPIVSPAPTGPDAVRLLDLVLDATVLPGFYELKRGRTGPPQFGNRP